VEETEVAVVGAGPAGLAVCVCLRQSHVDFVILEKERQVGASWHRHYERLHLAYYKKPLFVPFRSADNRDHNFAPLAAYNVPCCGSARKPMAEERHCNNCHTASFAGQQACRVPFSANSPTQNPETIIMVDCNL
jgi:Pyridine nucleotide-disulphide oxidoreductase